MSEPNHQMSLQSCHSIKTARDIVDVVTIQKLLIQYKYQFKMSNQMVIFLSLYNILNNKWVMIKKTKKICEAQTENAFLCIYCVEVISMVIVRRICASRWAAIFWLIKGFLHPWVLSRESLPHLNKHAHKLRQTNKCSDSMFLKCEGELRITWMNTSPVD